VSTLPIQLHVLEPGDGEHLAFVMPLLQDTAE
jgi:hypothetical protein